MNVIVTIECHSGARLVTLMTPHIIKEIELSKRYIILIPILSTNYLKTIIFRLSLRQMEIPLNQQKLFTIGTIYNSSDQGLINTSMGPISVVRTPMRVLNQNLHNIKYRLDRYYAIMDMLSATELASNQDYSGAIKIITRRIETIAHPDNHNLLVLEILNILEECCKNISDSLTFINGGNHSIRMMISEYQMEYHK